MPREGGASSKPPTRDQARPCVRACSVITGSPACAGDDNREVAMTAGPALRFRFCAIRLRMVEHRAWPRAVAGEAFVQDRYGESSLTAIIRCYAVLDPLLERAGSMSKQICKSPLLWCAVLGAFTLVSAAAAQPAPAGQKPDVTLGSTPDTVVWGYISARVPPVLRISSGATVR